MYVTGEKVLSRVDVNACTGCISGQEQNGASQILKILKVHLPVNKRCHVSHLCLTTRQNEKHVP